jgi:hypothetical protein
MTLGRRTQDQSDATRIRPFQGRTLSWARFPGALPPATVSIPSGDQRYAAPRTFPGRKKQVKRLPAQEYTELFGGGMTLMVLDWRAICGTRHVGFSAI